MGYDLLARSWERRAVALGHAAEARGWSGRNGMIEPEVDVDAGRKMMLASQLFRFPGSVPHDSAVDTWMNERPGNLGAIAHYWFGVIRVSGDDVRELLHDGHPTACVTDAAFAYVNAFSAHVNVGFFRGAELTDPSGLLVGTGKFMRHVKIRPGVELDSGGLIRLIHAAYADMKQRLRAE